MELERLRAHAGYTALHCSARDGEVSAVVDLLRKGEDKDALDTFGATPLMHAAEEGHLLVTETLLAEGADLTLHNTEGGETALHLAAGGGFLSIVNALLDGGADKDFQAANGLTPLMEAARYGHLPVVNTLLKRDADITLVCDTPYGDRADDFVNGECTALHLAVYARHLGVVNALLSKGADKDWRGPYGMTALMVAVGNRDMPIVRCLMTAGVDANALDEEGRSALNFAIPDFSRGMCTAEFVQPLLAGGADPDIGRSYESGRTPLGVATSNRDIGAMKSLIAYGAGLSTSDSNGQTPLHVACYSSDPYAKMIVARAECEDDGVLKAMPDFLLRSGADETAEDNSGKTPADMTKIDSVRKLLANAPADRVWRRRGWLVMLRARGDRLRAAVGDGGDGGDVDPHPAQRQAMEVRGGSGVERGQNSDISEVIASILALEMEGVFRNVVSFL